MENSEKPLTEFDEYKKRKQWAREMADEHGISLDEHEEHFVIPVLDSDGKEIRKEFLSIQKYIPVNHGKATKEEPSSVATEDAIEAVKRYPDMRLAEAVKKIREENRSKK